MSQNYASPLPKPTHPRSGMHFLMRQKREKQKRMLLAARLLLLLTLALLVLLLTGCASLCPKPKEVLVYAPTKLPLPPALTTLIPLQSYSSTAEDVISTWQQKLTGTPTTQKH